MSLKLLRTKFFTRLAALCLVLLSAQTFAAFIPVGVQVGVDKMLVSDTWGWTECYSGPGNASGISMSGILAGCNGDYLMMAAYKDGASDYAVLAAAMFDEVTFDTGVQSGNLSDTDFSHAANGSQWYFSDSWSWGFSELGSVVRLNSCDLGLSPSFEGNVGMCWHTSGGNLNSGWALNDGTFFQSLSSSYNRVLLVANASVPEPATFTILALGIAGLGLFKRRRKLR